MSDELDFFVALERQVWDALRRGDREADAALLADDFLGDYETGSASKADHVGQLAHGPTVAEYSLAEPALQRLTPTSVSLSYRATFRRPMQHHATTWDVISVWQERSGKWLNVFSRDTPADKPKRAPQPRQTQHGQTSRQQAIVSLLARGPELLRTDDPADARRILRRGKHIGLPLRGELPCVCAKCGQAHDVDYFKTELAVPRRWLALLLAPLAS